MARLRLGHWDNLLVVLIIAAGAWFRLTAYGDLGLSVATMDTQSYMQSARVSLLSWNALTGERLFATNLLYKLAGAEDCPIQALSVPAAGREPHREPQSCFKAVILTQTILSVLGWGGLIASFSFALGHGIARVAAAVILTVFGYVPQIADWDSILGAESLSFSLFALSLGLLIQILARSRGRRLDGKIPGYTLGVTVLAVLVLGVWSLVRDSNVYIIITLCVAILCFIILRRPRQRVRALLAASLAVLFGIASIGLISAYEGGRWRTPLANAFEEYILPYPSRISTLQRLGMPSPTSASYQNWFDQRAPASYMVFLGTHPGFVTTTIIDRLSSLFADNNQPYFKTPDLPLRNLALNLGDLFHSKSSSTILIDVVVVLGIGVVALRSQKGAAPGWAWLITWLLVCAVATLVLTFFADPIGVERHVLLSLVLLRLILWMGLLILIDLAATEVAPWAVKQLALD